MTEQPTEQTVPQQDAEPTLDSGEPPKTVSPAFDDVLPQRLAIRWPKVVTDIHDYALRIVKVEEDVVARLDAKANALFASTGLAVTLSISFGASILLGHSEYFAGLDRTVRGAAVFLFFVSVAAGLSASLAALGATRVQRGATAMAEEELLRADIVAHVDGCPEEEHAVRNFRRYAAEHLILIARENRKLAQRKSRWVFIGQVSLLVFLLTILVLAGIVAFSAYRSVQTEVRHEQRR